MEFLNSFKEKKMTSRQREINEEATSNITLTDFENKIFIAYNSTPLIPVEDTWTPTEILTKLEETRNGYIEYKMSKLNRPMTLNLL